MSCSRPREDVLMPSRHLRRDVVGSDGPPSRPKQTNMRGGHCTQYDVLTDWRVPFDGDGCRVVPWQFSSKIASLIAPR